MPERSPSLFSDVVSYLMIIEKWRIILSMSSNAIHPVFQPLWKVVVVFAISAEDEIISHRD